MIIPNEKLELLEECAETFSHTHSDVDYLLKMCKWRLDDTHCYDTEIYKKLN